MFSFKITKKAKGSSARTGTFKTPHGTIKTPVFMPVGTKATVKTLSKEDLEKLDAQIILANTYHLYLRPGENLVKEMGGLHKWMNWDKPILTDSGGFQVFSLAVNKDHHKNKSFKTTVKIDENGVEFKSHLDGAKHYLTPEKATKIQHDLGADIIMAFDECAPAHSSKKYFEQAMKRTHEWLERCKKEHEKLTKKNGSQIALFGIVQGGLHKDLREESAKFVNNMDLPGNAIGGLSVGESRKEMLEMLEAALPHLTDKKPRYLMGVGTPTDLLHCVDKGVDMFDCVLPTRIARHGTFWTKTGTHSIKNQRFKKDEKPLEKNCECASCKNHSRSYIRHLITENEILGMKLITVHNLHFLLNFMREIRESIKNNEFPKLKKEFLKNFKSKKKTP